MSLVTIIWSMIASSCLALAMVYLLIWWRRREAGANLLFALMGMAAAVFAGFELWMMRAVTTETFAMAVRWIHVPTWVLTVSLVGFVRVYLRAGRPWLAWTICGVRSLSLILNLLWIPNLNFRKITALRHVSFLGEEVAIAIGVPNPWMLVGQLSLLLLLIFVVDAAITVWRRGERQRALSLGGSIIVFVIAGTGQAILVLWGFIHVPITVSPFFLGILVAMAYELSEEVFRVARLSEDLRESQQRMALATHAADVGIWVRDLIRNEIWATDKWRVLFGFAKSERIDFNGFLQRLHLEDREAVKKTLADAIISGDYEKEYRVLLPNGETRWIASRGRIEFDRAGKPILLRGASLDITKRKQAEEAAQSLSGRLIHAQEAERTRLARDLHDDLSQSLALLSVEMEIFGQKPPAEYEQVGLRMQEFSTQVKKLSSEVHQLSHELHPAKLEQLGLAAALRGFCREFAAAHQMAIEFAARTVPRALPEDTALCLYRIAQEALHNVVKHSGVTVAKVELAMEGSELRLAVADEGVGFDPLATHISGSLGLVSMGERTRLVHGLLCVDSHAGAGTRVEVRVPLAKGVVP